MLAYAESPAILTSSEGAGFLRAAGATRSLSQPSRPFDKARRVEMAKGIFVGLSESDLVAIRDTAVADIKSGRVITSYSDSGTSVSKQYAMPPKEMLGEAMYALRQLDPDTYGKAVRVIRTDYRSFDGF